MQDDGKHEIDMGHAAPGAAGGNAVADGAAAGGGAVAGGANGGATAKRAGFKSDAELVARARYCGLRRLDTPEAAQALEAIDLIYTDLDGTLLAPGGRLLRDFAGNPSSALPLRLEALAHAGVHIVIVTGRNYVQGTEIMRLISADAVICEMGTFKQQGYGAQAILSLDTGDFVVEPQFDSPWQAIAESGALELLYRTYPGRLEPNTPWNGNRKVTHMLRGEVDPIEVDQLLADHGFALQLKDNGATYTARNTLVGCSVIHGYHVVPRDTSKALAVKRDLEQRRATAAAADEPMPHAVAIGDGFSDLEMGVYADALVAMLNGLHADRNRDYLKAAGFPKFVTSKRTIDGWVEFADAILAAKRRHGCSRAAR